MNRRSPLAMVEGAQPRQRGAAPVGHEPLDPDILRIIQALARADEAADYARAQAEAGDRPEGP